MNLPKETQALVDMYKSPLPAYAFPGGYPLFYIDGLACISCPDCANTAIEEQLAGELWDDCDLPVACETYLEGPDMECENGGCGKVIEAAYEDGQDV